MFADKLPDDADLISMWDAYTRFRKVVTERQFVTTEGGRFGWVPDTASGSREDQVQRGDSFVVVLGCSVPLVVRRCLDGTYQVLGDGYVQGFMDGEALQIVEDGSVKLERLTFC